MVRRVPADWQRQIDRFRAEGLSNADLAEAARIAKASNADDEWRYFCGVCWNMVTERMSLGDALRSPRE